MASIADDFGTPLHVCCREAVSQSIEAFRQPFIRAELELGYHYSVKTNPIPEALRILKGERFGVEVVSPYELWLVQRLGFEGDDIIITGMGWDHDYCLDVAQAGPEMWSLESLSQVQYVASLSEQFETPVNIGLRICPILRSSRFNFTVSNGLSNSPHGFIPGSEGLDDALQIIDRSDALNFIGFSFHLGSGIRHSRPYEQALGVMSDVILSAASKGRHCRYVNIGGGFGSAAAPVLGLYDIARSFLGFNRREQKGGAQNDLLNNVAHILKAFLDKLGKSGAGVDKILIEPGRAITGPGQIILLTVNEVTKRPGNRKFLICDGGAMSLSPSLYTEHHRIVPLKHREGESVKCTILGTMPSSLDIVARLIDLPEIKVGDRLAILDTGAYFFSFNNNFSGPRPGVVLIENGRFRLLHRRETFEDLVAYGVDPQPTKVTLSDGDGSANGRSIDI